MSSHLSVATDAFLEADWQGKMRSIKIAFEKCRESRGAADFVSRGENPARSGRGGARRDFVQLALDEVVNPAP
jgi:hypothetical protein